MATRKKAIQVQKPKLIQVGKHLVNPADIACISKVKKGLFIVKRLSEPNPTFPIWVHRPEDLTALLKEFNLVLEDIPEDDIDLTDPIPYRWDR